MRKKVFGELEMGLRGGERSLGNVYASFREYRAVVRLNGRKLDLLPRSDSLPSLSIGCETSRFESGSQPTTLEQRLSDAELRLKV